MDLISQSLAGMPMLYYGPHALKTGTRFQAPASPAQAPEYCFFTSCLVDQDGVKVFFFLTRRSLCHLFLSIYLLSLWPLDPGHHWVSLTLGFDLGIWEQTHSLLSSSFRVPPSGGGDCALDGPFLKTQYKLPPWGEGAQAMMRSQRLSETSHP